MPKNVMETRMFRKTHSAEPDAVIANIKDPKWISDLIRIYTSAVFRTVFSSQHLMGFRVYLSGLVLLVCHTLAALDFGPCDVLISNFEPCPEVSNPKIKIVVKQKRINSTTFAYDVSIVNTIPIDLSLSSRFDVFEVPNRGRLVNTTMGREFKQFCKSTKAYLPDTFNAVAKAIKKASGENLYGCDLPPGSREAHDIIFDDKSSVFPSVFWYKKYIAKIYLKKKREIVGCNQITLQTVQKKR